MNFFKNTNEVTGTKTNSILALVFTSLAIISCLLYFFVGKQWLVLSLILWGGGVFQTLKGVKSDFPKPAKIARILAFAGAVVIIVLCILYIYSTFRMFF